MNNFNILKELESIRKPNSKLEQYFTPPHIALEYLEKINLKGKIIVDLGCGNGMLGLTALLLGARKVYFIDIDKELLFFAERNYVNMKKKLGKINLGEAEFINKDISLIKKSVLGLIDIAILNPPFGTIDDSKKIDVVFLKKAIKLANTVISMHKTASKRFIKRVIFDNKFKIIYMNDFLFSIPKTYSYHKQDVTDIEVTLVMAEKQQSLKKTK
jgi:putative methylase